MKNSMKNLKSSILGIAVTGFLFCGLNTVSGQDAKPEGKPWPCPEKFVKMTNPVKVDASVLAKGKELWSLHCKSCHGKTGKGDGTKAENIDISCGDFTSDKYQKMSDGELYWKTVEGRKPMPSYKQKLTETENWTVVLYTRTFAKKGDTVQDIKSK